MRYNTQKKIDQVAEYRRLPSIKKGMRCEVSVKQGEVIGGTSSGNLNILFDGDKEPTSCHPHWQMKVFGYDGKVIHNSEIS